MLLDPPNFSDVSLGFDTSISDLEYISETKKEGYIERK